MTSREVARELGLDHKVVRARMGEMPTHICGWRRDSDGGRLYLRALFANGERRDSPKPPKLTRYETTQRYRERKAGLVNSVFSLAVPIDVRRVYGPR